VRADNQAGTAGVTPEDLAAAATMPSYLDDDASDEEEAQVAIPSKKPTGTTSKTSKKKADQIETEYKKASEHPDLAQIEKSRKRGIAEGSSENVNSSKKVHSPSPS